MTDYTYQATLIVPSAQLEAAQRIAEAMGWGTGNYAVSINNGTYYGLSAPVTQSFVDMMLAAELGAAPNEEVDVSDIEEVLPVLIKSIEPRGIRTQKEQFDAVLTENNLTMDSYDGEV